MIADNTHRDKITQVLSDIDIIKYVAVKNCQDKRNADSFWQ